MKAKHRLLHFVPVDMVGKSINAGVPTRTPTDTRKGVTMRKALLFHMLLALLLLPSPAWPQDSTLTFDGGATRIVETHGD
jgi:hypothetical protein